MASPARIKNRIPEKGNGKTGKAVQGRSTLALISFTGVRWAWCIGMNSKCSSPLLSARRFASGPVASLRIVISHWHDVRKGRRLRNLVQHKKWPIVSGGQGHDSEVRVSEFFFFFFSFLLHDKE